MMARMVAMMVVAGTTAVLGGCQPTVGNGVTPVEVMPSARRIIDDDGIVVPPGFRIEVAARGLTYPTGIAFDGQGRPHVVEAGYAAGEDWTTPRLLRIEPDGSTTVVAEGGDGPWNGVVWHDGAFFVAQGGHLNGGAILRIAQDGTVRPLVEGLPSLGDHSTTGPVVGPDGWIYFGQGTTTNAGVVGEDSARQGWLKRFPTVHDVPCRDVVLNGHNFTSTDPWHPGRMILTGAYSPFGISTRRGQTVAGRVPCGGAILRVSPQGGAPELVAWGLRNPYGLAFAADGQLYVTDHGYDRRGSRPVPQADDLLWRITADRWYGWPDYHGDRPLPASDDGDGPITAPPPLLATPPGTPPPPLATLGAGAGAAGLDISRDGAALGLQGKALVALEGPIGSRVVAVNLATGATENFAVNRDFDTNRAQERDSASWLERIGFGRPVAVGVAPGGQSVYVVDFGTMTLNGRQESVRRRSGLLWRITKATP
ncbi:MAG: PQQ-dependent sugar dehydrogenase [Alphaproteobacteria bacterium]